MLLPAGCNSGSIPSPVLRLQMSVFISGVPGLWPAGPKRPSVIFGGREEPTSPLGGFLGSQLLPPSTQGPRHERARWHRVAATTSGSGPSLAPKGQIK